MLDYGPARQDYHTLLCGVRRGLAACVDIRDAVRGFYWKLFRAHSPEIFRVAPAVRRIRLVGERLLAVSGEVAACDGAQPDETTR